MYDCVVCELMWMYRLFGVSKIPSRLIMAKRGAKNNGPDHTLSFFSPKLRICPKCSFSTENNADWLQYLVLRSIYLYVWESVHVAYTLIIKSGIENLSAQLVWPVEKGTHQSIHHVYWNHQPEWFLVDVVELELWLHILKDERPYCQQPDEASNRSI